MKRSYKLAATDCGSNYEARIRRHQLYPVLIDILTKNSEEGLTPEIQALRIARQMAFPQSSLGATLEKTRDMSVDGDMTKDCGGYTDDSVGQQITYP